MTAVSGRTLPPSGAVVARLAARSFALEVAKHPVIIAGVIVSAWLSVTTLFEGATVWQELSASAGGVLLPLVAAAYLVGNLTASREIHYRYEEHTDSLPYGRTIRTIGMMGGVLAPLAYGLLLIMLIFGSAAFFSPAGTMMWAEALTAPLAIAVGWLAGMVLRSGSRFLAAPVLGIIFYAALHMAADPDVTIGAPQGVGFDYSRLLLWMHTSIFDSPMATLLRPSWHRVAFLSSVALFLVSFLLARSRERTTWSTILPILTSALLAATIGVLTLSWEPDEPWARSGYFERPVVFFGDLEPLQECTTADGTSYCTYPGFAPWASHWMTAIAASRATAFPSQIKAVVQRPEHETFAASDPGPDGVVSFFQWDRPGTARPDHRFALISRVGQKMVGFPDATSSQCDARGQGRSVFPLWLAGALGSQERSILADLRSTRGPIWAAGQAPLGAAVVDEASVLLALHLTELPRADVEGMFQARWNDLTDPAVSIADVARWIENVPDEVLDTIENAPQPEPSALNPLCD